MKKTLSVDLSEDQLKDVAVGDTVTVTVTGKVVAAEAGQKPDKRDKKMGFEGFPPSMRVEVASVDVECCDNEYADMAKEDM